MKIAAGAVEVIGVGADLIRHHLQGAAKVLHGGLEFGVIVVDDASGNLPPATGPRRQSR